jgi:hypothetical protein
MHPHDNEMEPLYSLLDRFKLHFDTSYRAVHVETIPGPRVDGRCTLYVRMANNFLIVVYNIHSCPNELVDHDIDDLIKYVSWPQNTSLPIDPISWVNQGDVQWVDTECTQQFHIDLNFRRFVELIALNNTGSLPSNEDTLVHISKPDTGRMVLDVSVSSGIDELTKRRIFEFCEVCSRQPNRSFDLTIHLSSILALRKLIRYSDISVNGWARMYFAKAAVPHDTTIYVYISCLQCSYKCTLPSQGGIFKCSRFKY